MTKVVVTDSTRELLMSPRLSPRAHRLIRSYGLLILIALAFLLMAMLVRTVDRTVPADQGWGTTEVGVVS